MSSTKAFDQLWIELAPCPSLELVQGCLNRHRIASPRPPVRHRVECIADRNDAGLLRNRFAAQTVRIATTVVSLVMLLSDHGCDIQDPQLRLAQQFSSILRMRPHDMTLTVGQSALLLQYAGRNSHHPNVA